MKTVRYTAAVATIIMSLLNVPIAFDDGGQGLVKPVAYLCLGYVDEFAPKPDLERAGWLPRMDLARAVCYERWGTHQPEEWKGLQDAVKSSASSL